MNQIETSFEISSVLIMNIIYFKKFIIISKLYHIFLYFSFLKIKEEKDPNGMESEQFAT